MSIAVWEQLHRPSSAMVIETLFCFDFRFLLVWDSVFVFLGIQDDEDSNLAINNNINKCKVGQVIGQRSLNAVDRLII